MGPGFEPQTTHFNNMYLFRQTGNCLFVADLAQLVEHRSCKAEVEGSNPLVGIMRT